MIEGDVLIELQNVSKTFHTDDGVVTALQDCSLTINDGDIFGIIGLSGVRKSTLLQCINLLERPTSGSVRIDGTELTVLSTEELQHLKMPPPLLPRLKPISLQLRSELSEIKALSMHLPPKQQRTLSPRSMTVLLLPYSSRSTKTDGFVQRLLCFLGA